MEKETEFKECKECSKKSGSPTLCEGCLHNRNAMQILRNEKYKLEKTLEIIKELVGLQGIY